MCDLLTFNLTFQRYKRYNSNITTCSFLTPTAKEPEYSNVYQRGAGLLQRRARVIQYKVHVWPVGGKHCLALETGRLYTNQQTPSLVP